jgi:hypothetical protein
MECNNNTELNTCNLKQGLLYNKNIDDLNNKPSQPSQQFNIIKDFLQLFSKNNVVESYVGSISQVPLDVPILGESGSQVNRINGLNASTISGSGTGSGTNTGTWVGNETRTRSGTGTGTGTGATLTAGQQNIQLKYNQFNQLLAQYTAQYKIMSDDLVQNNSKNILQKYANSNIKLDNDFYFVNEYGYANKYDGTDNPTTGTISSSCNFGEPPTEITQLEYNKLLPGRKQGANQPCVVAGYNVENSSTGEKSFVDIEGVKHIYSGEVWNKRNESCYLDKKSIGDSEYKNIPLGDPMKDTTYCATIHVDPLVLEKLASLSKQLKELGTNTLTEINSIVATQEQTNTNNLNNANFIKSSITEKLEQLNKSQQDILRIGDEYNSTGDLGLVTDSSNTIKARNRDSQISVNMNYLKYIIGFLLTLFLVITTFYVFSYELSSPLLVLLLIILIIIVLFNFFSFMYNKLYHKFLNKILLYS